MKALWVDPSNGAAGDMLLAALLDAGASLETVRAGLGRLRVEPIAVEVGAVRRHGFRATLVSVSAPEASRHHPTASSPLDAGASPGGEGGASASLRAGAGASSRGNRGLAEITELIRAAALPPSVSEFAIGAFTRLAEAEAHVHGIAIDQVHFHEVGALDAIADVVGCGLALDDLGLLGAATRIVGPVAVGSGAGRTAHGRMPVPAPAVLEVLTRVGSPIAAHPATMELCTPTGAALLATLATGWGPPPSLVPRAVGVGAGTNDAESHPNVLRVLVGDALVGDAEAGVPDWSVAELYEVQATVDDLDPRVWPDLLEALRSTGAADAWCTPALMRKGRPGQVLSVLADADRLDLVCRVVFTQTTTLGLRVRGVHRRALRRDEVRVTVAGQPVGVKRGYLGQVVVTVQPEYDDARAAAERTGLPLADVLTQAREAALESS